MEIIYWIVIGLVVGLIARALKPGDDSMGWIWTILLGIGGAILGGFLADLVGLSASNMIVSIIFSVIGAIILLFIYHFVRRKV